MFRRSCVPLPVAARAEEDHIERTRVVDVRSLDPAAAAAMRAAARPYKSPRTNCLPDGELRCKHRRRELGFGACLAELRLHGVAAAPGRRSARTRVRVACCSLLGSPRLAALALAAPAIWRAWVSVKGSRALHLVACRAVAAAYHRDRGLAAHAALHIAAASSVLPTSNPWTSQPRRWRRANSSRYGPGLACSMRSSAPSGLRECCLAPFS